MNDDLIDAFASALRQYQKARKSVRKQERQSGYANKWTNDCLDSSRKKLGEAFAALVRSSPITEPTDA